MYLDERFIKISYVDVNSLPDARKVTLLAFGSRDATEEGGTSRPSLEVSAGRALVRRVVRGARVSSRRGAEPLSSRNRLSAVKAQPLRSSLKEPLLRRGVRGGV